MENKTNNIITKYIVIFITAIILLTVVSVATTQEVTAAKVVDKDKCHSIDSLDFGWESKGLAKKKGKHYIKYTKELYIDKSCNYLFKHYNCGWYEKCLVTGNKCPSHSNNCNYERSYFKKQHKLVNYKLPKGYVAYAADATKDAQKFVRKNGKTSIKPNRYWNGKKVHSGVYSIAFRYNNKEYIKKIQVKAGTKKAIKVPRSAIIHDATLILIAKGKRIRVYDVDWYMKG